MLQIINWDNGEVYFEGSFDDCIQWMRDNHRTNAWHCDKFSKAEKEEFENHDVRLYGNEKVYIV